MNSNSIFARHWWSISLRTAEPKIDRVQRLNRFASEIALALGGVLAPNSQRAQLGLSKVSIKQPDAEEETENVAALYIATSGESYFPLPEDSLESGSIEPDEYSSHVRDFPRKVQSGQSTLYQYPLLVALGKLAKGRRVFTIASPYFQMLRAILNSIRLDRNTDACIAINVSKAFGSLKEPALENGELTVRAGRMVIRGIENLRMAVFHGDNVIGSPLYSQLESTEGVTVTPKDCKLRRSYIKPVGGNCRPFVAWFDSNGNFRFTPGLEPISGILKFLELLDILDGLRLTRDAESSNPMSYLRGRNTVQ